MLRSYWFASDNLYPLPRIDPEWASTHFSASPANEMVLQNATRYLHDSFPGEQKWNTPEGCQWALDTVQR